MSPFSGGLPLFWQNIGLLAGLVMTLCIASYLIRDNFLVRLAQYLLVGASLGYIAVLTWSNVLWPRLFAPLLEEPLPFFAPHPSLQDPLIWQSWLPLLLGLLLWLVGVETWRRPPQSRSGRAWLRLLAVIPAALLAGVGLGAGVAGALQGTLFPQLLRAIQLGALRQPAVELWPLGVLTLLITGGVLIHIQFGARTSKRSALPQALERAVLAFGWIGQRALWMAAGFLFARLAVARFTLVIARMNYLLFEFPKSDLWNWLLVTLRGGGP